VPAPRSEGLLLLSVTNERNDPLTNANKKRQTAQRTLFSAMSFTFIEIAYAFKFRTAVLRLLLQQLNELDYSFAGLPLSFLWYLTPGFSSKSRLSLFISDSGVV
jgi:hypothetical protein